MVRVLEGTAEEQLAALAAERVELDLGDIGSYDAALDAKAIEVIEKELGPLIDVVSNVENGRPSFREWVVVTRAMLEGGNREVKRFVLSDETVLGILRKCGLTRVAQQLKPALTAAVLFGTMLTEGDDQGKEEAPQ